MEGSRKNIIWCEAKQTQKKKKNKTYSALFVDPSSQSLELDI